MAVEVPQTLEYTGNQLNATPILEVENFTNWKKRFMCHIIGIEPHFRIILLNGPYIPMIAGQRKPENQWTTDKRKATNLNQYKALMNELVNDGINLSKLEINTGFINRLPKKWLGFCQSLRNTNHVKDSELASLFDSPEDEEDTRNSQEYMNDLDEEYQARTLLAKSKRFFKKGTQRFNIAKVDDQPECHNSNASASKSSMVKNKGLVAEAYEWDEEEVSSDDNEMVEVKVFMALAEDENSVVGKDTVRNGEWVKIAMRK
ncbi:hypothetical protein Tco_0912440, partial [Tanacetum coccineum]